MINAKVQTFLEKSGKKTITILFLNCKNLNNYFSQKIFFFFNCSMAIYSLNILLKTTASKLLAVHPQK